MKNLLKISFFFMFILINLNADELGDMLLNIEKKTDLSQKTKMENGGISFVYTRDDLERMQVKSLKDILKLTYPLGYNESTYGLVDPFSMGTSHPFVSSMIRIFIDNQEVTTGYGSGLMILGDIDMGFVDHIEVYTQNPSYEFSTESTFILIKLFSKQASKDEGGKIELNGGSYGQNRASIYHSKELDNWSYFSYFTKTDDKRKKYNSFGTELSRDKKVTHIFGTFYNDNQKFLIQGIKREGDSFIDRSLNATPEKNNLDVNFLHIGYDLSNDYLSFLLTYDKMETNSDFVDDVMPLKQFNYMSPTASFNSELESDVYTAEIKYDYTTKKNRLIVGSKYRYKDFNYKEVKINGIDFPLTKKSNQQISTIFVENQYSLRDNSIITTGLNYSKIKNKSSIQQDDFFMYRLGHTFTTNDWIFKTVYSKTKTSLETYLVNSYNFYITKGKKELQVFNSFIENIIYQKNNNKYEILLDYLRSENILFPTKRGLLENAKKDVIQQGVNFMWTHDYNKYDKLFMSFGYMEMKDMPPFFKTREVYTSIIRNLNSYQKFDLFNELMYYKSNSDNKDYYNYSIGAKYHHTKDLTFSLKGENILDKAKPTRYRRIDPKTFYPQETLLVSPIDKKFILSVEYLF